MMIAAKLQQLGIELPDPPKPVASYVPAQRTGNLIFVSGQLPFRDGSLPPEYIGRVPSECSPDTAQHAARQCVLNALAVLRGAVSGDLDSVKRIVRLGVFVRSDPGFDGQPGVANGASDLLVDIFAEKGRHARAAIGCIALPLGSCIEVEMIAEV